MIKTKGKQAVIILYVLLLLLFGALFITTKNFVFRSVLHMLMSLLAVPICLTIIKKCLQSQLNASMSKVLLFCGIAIFADLVVCDGIRYVLSSGVNTVLFLPACLPICFMLIMFYSTKDTGKDKTAEKRLTYLVGIPLLLTSLYFEVLSFLQI